MTHPFLTEWANWRPTGPPYVFPGDEEVMGLLKDRGLTCAYVAWPEYYATEEFGRGGDRRLHLGLLPHPFAGDLQSAKVVILLLNPGLGPLDAFAELTQPEFKAALHANLRRQPIRGGGFMFLDPHFGWHGGFQYWHSKLQGVIAELATRWTVSYAMARERLKAAFATLELVPYHSARFDIPQRFVNSMRSAQLARQFVYDVLLPRARGGECLLLVTRKAREWGLHEESGVVVYGNVEARAAHLTPRSRGGSALLEFAASRLFA